MAGLKLDKTQLRHELRRRRRAVNSVARTLAANLIVRHAIRSGLLLRHRRIAIYLPHGTEINTLVLLNRMLSMGKQVYLPMLPFGRGKKLWFNRAEVGARWILNRFGMAENQSQSSVRVKWINLLFMPLLGYDDAGYRIGTGGGYYDASLAYLRQRRQWQAPYLVGIAFACQHIDGKLVPDAWDIPLDAILTEQGLHCFGSARE